MSQRFLGTTRVQYAGTQLVLAYDETHYCNLAVNAQGGMDISLVGVTGAADGWKITNGTDNFNLIRDDTNLMSLDADLSSMDISCSAAFSIDGVGASNLSVTSGDLTISTITDGSLLFSTAKNYGFGTSSFDGTAVGVLSIANGTAPAAHVDNTIQIYSTDSSDSTSTLGLMLEQAIEDIGTFTGSHKIKIKINGTEYWLQLDVV